MPTPLTELYALERHGKPDAVMICVAGVDPFAEAARGGDVVSVRRITAAEADAIKARRPIIEPASIGAVVNEPTDLTDVLRVIQDLAVLVDDLRASNARLRYEMDAIIGAEIKEQRIVA
ncbi:MAG: hypothetical protein E6Q97_13775 [Desulfurellales bacterium]|nr:MAG: hypothetical protein E6Q97_13775 [Desulfurellales bacterium]